MSRVEEKLPQLPEALEVTHSSKGAGMSLQNKLVINISEASSLTQAVYTTRLFHSKAPPHLQLLAEPQGKPIQGHFQCLNATI